MPTEQASRAKVFIAYGLAAALIALATLTTITEFTLNTEVLWAFAALIGTLLGVDLWAKGGE